MRGIESLMLAGLVGLLGVGVWQGRHWLPNLLPSATQSSVAPGIGSKKESEGKLAAKKLARTPAKSRKPAVTAAGMLPGVPSTTTTVVVPLPSIPTAGSIKAGTSRTELRARYGDPSLDISARQNGRLVERFYYLSSDETQLTVATLQDGNVTSAETVSR